MSWPIHYTMLGDGGRAKLPHDSPVTRARETSRAQRRTCCLRPRRFPARPSLS
jgi:hypothetical protein